MVLAKTKKKIIILSTLAFFLVASYCFLVTNILQKGREIYSMSKEIKDIQARRGELLSMQKNLFSSGEMVIKLEDFVLKTGSEVEFIKKIEDMSVLSNVKSEIKTAKITEISGNNSIIAENFKVGLEAIGSWSDVIYFLTLIENLPLKVTINNVSFNKFSDYGIKEQKIPQWLLSIDFSVIKQK